MKLWTSVLVLLLVVGLAGVAEAAKGGGQGGGKGGRKGGILADPDAVTGRITAVAAIKAKPDMAIVIKSGKGKNATTKDVAVIANADTKVTLDGQPATLEDLKVGAQAKVTVSNSSATKIEATSAAGGKGGGRKNK